MRRVVLVILVIAAAGLAGLWFHQNADGGASYKFVTAPAELGRLRDTVTATGTVNAVVTVNVGSQLSGLINRLYVDFNSPVEKNQPLARLDQNTFKAKLSEAEAALEMARAQIKIQQAAVETAEKNTLESKAQFPVLEAQLESAQARFGIAKSNFDRKGALRGRGAVSTRDFEQAMAERAAASAGISEVKAVLAAHQQKVAATEAGVTRAKAELGNAIAKVRQQEAVLRVAQIDLERTVIRSPVKGVVIKRDVEQGQTVAASLEAPTLFTIAQDLREMQVNAFIDETDIGKIRVGQSAIFSVDAFRARQFHGEVIQIRKAPEVKQNVVTYTVVIATQNPDLSLLPGMTALIKIVVMETDALLKVPRAALAFKPTGATPIAEPNQTTAGRQGVVWRLGTNGTPVPVHVQLGKSDRNSIELLDPAIKKDEQLIVSEIPTSTGTRFFGIRVGF